MNDTLTALLLQLSEGSLRRLWGRVARPHFGPVFDRLLADGVLTERAPAEEWSACVDCDCGFDVRPIQRIGDRIVAACPFDASKDTELMEDDLRDFGIDPDRLVALFAEASGFFGPIEALATDLWRVGRLASGRSVVVGLVARALDHPGIVLLLKAAGGGAPVTVVAPDPGPAIRLRFLEAGIDLVELRSALKSNERWMYGLDSEALEPKAGGPRLSIQVAGQAVLIDGTPQHVAAQPFRLLTLLAKHRLDGAGPVRNREIEDATGRDARDLVRELRHALAARRANALEIRAWITARRSLGAFELAIEPGQIELSHFAW